MSKTTANKIAKLLSQEKQIEENLLIKKNKNLPKSLRRLISIKRKLALLSLVKSLDDPQVHEQE